VTVLKPLCGAEPGLYEHLRSFYRHDVLVMADSDAFVGPDYLASVTVPLLDGKSRTRHLPLALLGLL